MFDLDTKVGTLINETVVGLVRQFWLFQVI
jgi:hypothetical protein